MSQTAKKMCKTCGKLKLVGGDVQTYHEGLIKNASAALQNARIEYSDSAMTAFEMGRKVDELAQAAAVLSRPKPTEPSLRARYEALEKAESAEDAAQRGDGLVLKPGTRRRQSATTNKHNKAERRILRLDAARRELSAMRDAAGISKGNLDYAEAEFKFESEKPKTGCPKSTTPCPAGSPNAQLCAKVDILDTPEEQALKRDAVCSVKRPYFTRDTKGISGLLPRATK
jgi:hypothetical protein